jgi:hypothetical protein
MRAGLLEDLKVVLKVAEKVLNLVVEGTHEEFPRGRAQRLLERRKGLDKIMKLETYASYQECQIERNRIGFEMAAAYPYDRDFVIACRLSTRHES